MRTIQNLAAFFTSLTLGFTALSIETGSLSARAGYYIEYFSQYSTANYDETHDSAEKEESILAAYQSPTEPTYKYFKYQRYHGSNLPIYGSDDVLPYDPEDQWCTLVERASSTLTVSEKILWSAGYSSLSRYQAFHVKPLRVAGEIALGKTVVTISVDLADTDFDAATVTVTTDTYTKPLSSFQVPGNSYYISMYGTIHAENHHSISEVPETASLAWFH